MLGLQNHLVYERRRCRSIPCNALQARPAGGALMWQVQTPVRALCAGDFRAPLRLEVWEAAGGGGNARVTLAGAASTNLRALQEQPRLALSAHGKVRQDLYSKRGTPNTETTWNPRP